jgi:type IV secretion system protein VirD4
VGAVIPNLLTAKRSILCIDPKGENAAVAADARARFGPVYVLDPFTVSGSVGAAFNPLADLDPQSRDLPEDAAVIADALVQDPPHQTGDAHWNEEAKALIAGVVLHVVTTQAVGERTLSRVRDLLTGPQDQFLALLDDMQANPGAGGLVARAANRHLSKGDREAAGVLSSAQRHTHFLDSDRMSQVMARSDFRFSDLRSKVVTIFLVLPPERLATHARWLRLLVVQALFALARTEQSGEGGAVSGGPPSALSWQRPVEASVLFLLDEFPALGPLDPIRRAFGLMAGYGVQLWVILQDLHQLKSVYGRDYGTFLSNAGLIQIFNVADLDTAAWVSRVLGPATQSVQGLGASTSRTVLQWFGSKGASVHSNLVRRELMTPDEVMRMASDRLILLTPGRRPALAKKVRYFADPEFRGLFPGPSAIHRASASRATAPTRLA